VTSGVLHLLVPGGIDDPSRPSGGNTYDRRLAAALLEQGWPVRVVKVEGGWPWSAAIGVEHLGQALADLPDGAIVVVDGLLASRLPSVMVPAGERLRVLLLVHLPVGVDDESARSDERRVVAAAVAVVTTSDWCREWLVAHYDVDARRVRVAHPGVAAARAVTGSAAGERLLTVGNLTPVKGQDRLLAALSDVRDLPWRWTCVGSTAVDPGFVARLHARAVELGVRDRLELLGPLTGDDLNEAYAATDLLVLPSRAETYGMVVTEALARAIPVLAADVGGVREALGETADGRRPGLLVRPDGLAAALRLWLGDATCRDDLRASARVRRCELVGWPETAGRVADVVRQVAA
jgi:glycosyltransferase involved in cell wall biosynthesis